MMKRKIGTPCTLPHNRPYWDICQIRRKYPYFGKEKIKKILEREDRVNISASSVGRIFSQYRSILPNMKVYTKRIGTLKKKRICLSQVEKDIQGVISEWLQVDTVELNLDRFYEETST